jgi:hypothetical protein
VVRLQRTRLGLRYSAGERLPHLRRGDLAALGVGARLTTSGELDLEPPRQIHLVLGLHDEGHPPSGLGVDLITVVGAPHVARVDRQVRDLPGYSVTSAPAATARRMRLEPF